MTALIQPTNTLQQAFMECHSEGHTWKRQPGRVDPSEAEPGMRPPYSMQRSAGRRALCLSCTTERVRWYTPSGEVINRYRYPEGYLHRKLGPDDDPAPSKQEWRRLLVVTLFDELEQPRRRRRAS